MKIRLHLALIFLMSAVNSTLVAIDPPNLENTITPSVIMQNINDIDNMLASISMPIKQTIIDHKPDGSVSCTFESVIVPSKKAIMMRYEFAPDANGKSIRSNYAFSNGKLCQQVGSADAWIPVNEKYIPKAIQLLNRVITYTNAKLLIAHFSTPLEGLVKGSRTASPEALVKLLERIDNIRKGNTEESQFSFSDEWLTIEGRKFEESNEIQSMEEFRDKRLVTSVNSEKISVEGIIFPKDTTFSKIKIGNKVIRVQEDLIERASGNIGAVFELIDGKLFVLGVKANSAAQASGLIAGDEITSINGDGFAGKSREDLLPMLRSLTTVKLSVLDANGTSSRTLLVK